MTGVYEYGTRQQYEGARTHQEQTRAGALVLPGHWLYIERPSRALAR